MVLKIGKGLCDYILMKLTALNILYSSLAEKEIISFMCEKDSLLLPGDILSWDRWCRNSSNCPILILFILFLFYF